MSDLLSESHLCWVWRLTLSDGTVWGFTDHDRVLNFEGLSCSPQGGFKPEDGEQKLGASIDHRGVKGLLSLEIKANDISAGRLDGAKLESFRVDWRDPTRFFAHARSFVDTVEQKSGQFHITVVGEGHKLEASTGRVFSALCDARFCDVRCGLNKENFPEGTKCPRTFTACRDRFDNSANFRGFPYLIGDDALTAGPKAGMVHDGGSRYQ